MNRIENKNHYFDDIKKYGPVSISLERTAEIILPENLPPVGYEKIILNRKSTEPCPGYCLYEKLSIRNINNETYFLYIIGG